MTWKVEVNPTPDKEDSWDVVFTGDSSSFTRRLVLSYGEMGQYVFCSMENPDGSPLKVADHPDISDLVPMPADVSARASELK